MKAMPPKLRSDDGRNIVIRPLPYCRESDLQALAELHEFPIIPCNLCGSLDGLQRTVVKEMLGAWERQYPGRTDTIFSALQHVSPSQLADTQLFDFSGLKLEGRQVEKDNEPATDTRIGALNL